MYLHTEQTEHKAWLRWVKDPPYVPCFLILVWTLILTAGYLGGSGLLIWRVLEPAS